VLLRSIASVASELSEILAEARELTPYGVEYRYPGDYPEVTVVDAEKSFRLAALVRSEVRNRLPHEAIE
jgi:HEPN domain-containing protein